jgi:alginate O-acetyltransferase complex protein AlgJ
MQKLFASKTISLADLYVEETPRTLSVFPENAFTVIFFLLIVFSLAIATWVIKPADYIPMESRKRALIPPFSFKKRILRKFTPAFESYFNDRFACRSQLLTLRSFLAYFLLHETGSSKVVAGDHGWFYLNQHKNLESFRNLQPYTTAELEHLVAGLQRQKDWLAQRHIRYLFFVAPGKPTIYPEHIPEQFNKTNKYSRLDQLISYIKKHSTIDVLDLRPVLKSSKQYDSIFYKTDSHWNDLGAFISYRVIGNYLAQWFPSIHILQLSDFRKEKIKFNGGGLTGMIGLNNLLTESIPLLIPLSQPKWFVSANPKPESSDIHGLNKVVPAFATEIKDQTLPKAVMLRDSFTTGLQPFLSNHFGRIVYLWRPDFPVDEIIKEHPDVVIQEVVERLLMCYLPQTLEDNTKDNSLVIHSER